MNAIVTYGDPPPRDPLPEPLPPGWVCIPVSFQVMLPAEFMEQATHGGSSAASAGTSASIVPHSLRLGTGPRHYPGLPKPPRAPFAWRRTLDALAGRRTHPGRLDLEPRSDAGTMQRNQKPLVVRTPQGQERSMAARQNDKQKRIVGRVMHEFKQGTLEQAQGGTVENPRQAIAIGLREAGASNRVSPDKNRKALRKTEAAERDDVQGESPTRAELYRQAAGKGIAGRSRMSKAELQQALARS